MIPVAMTRRKRPATGQEILFRPDADWQLPDWSDLPNWQAARRIGIDTETCDPDLKKFGPGVRTNGRVVGISFALEDGPAHYLPFGHLKGPNLPQANVVEYCRHQAANFTGTVVFANASYDLDYLAQLGITFPKAEWIRDVQVADPLIYELHNRYSLDAIAERLGMPLKQEGKLLEAAEAWSVPPKTGLWRLSPLYVGRYAEADARNPLGILRRQERIIDDNDLWGIYNLESKLTPILVQMRRHGVAIDVEKLQYIKRWAEGEIKDRLQQVRQLTGVAIDRPDLTQPDALRKVLVSVGVTVNKTRDGKWNIDKSVLAGCDHPVGEVLNDSRKLVKLVDTFAHSVEIRLVNGRLHPTFNQLKKEKDSGEDSGDGEGARFGRMSGTQPNIQQQPSRDAFAKMWRSIYLPDPGGEWTSFDYKGQEPRLLVHYAARCRMPGGAAACRRYCHDPNIDAYRPIVEATGLDKTYGPKRGRDFAKIITLGIGYGMGGGKLAGQLGLPTVVKTRRDGSPFTAAGPEAQAILDQFNQNAPYISALAKATEQKAKQTGIIKTILGRLCHFPLKPGTTEYDWTHKALNRLIQGSAADQTKAAVVALHEAGLTPQLQVHDEVDRTTYSKSERDAIADIMRTCVNTLVPMLVDVEVGPNWGDAK